VKWISGETNPANAFTKSKASIALKQLIDINIVNLQVVEWVKKVDKAFTS